MFALAGYALMLLILAHIIIFRYVVPLLPFFLIWASNGLEKLAGWTRETVEALINRKASSQKRAGRAAWQASCSAAILLFIVFGIAGARYLDEINESFAENLIVKQA